MKNTIWLQHIGFLGWLCLSAWGSFMYLQDLSVRSFFWHTEFLSLLGFAGVFLSFGSANNASHGGVSGLIAQTVILLGVFYMIFVLFSFWGNMIFYFFMDYVPFQKWVIYPHSFIIPFFSLGFYSMFLE